MQTPTTKTPVSKCLELATYAIRMFAKFTSNAALADFSAQLTIAKSNLAAAQLQYEEAGQEILPVRVDVKYENWRSDRRIRLTQQKAEMADGKKGGRIATVLFPDGSAPITRLIGDSQIKEMSDLEGRLDAVVDLWPDAAAEKTDIAQHRESYSTALKARDDQAQTARNKRALRNAAKEAFITKYVEITNRVAAEYPRDTVMQDLFFDEVRTKSAVEEADGDDGADAGGKETTGEVKPG